MIILGAMGRSVILAFIAGLIIKLFMFDLMITSGHSMEPAIKSGAVLIINRLQYGLRFPGQKKYLIRWGEPKPGELVVFYTPSGDIAVKRCETINSEGQFLAYGDNVNQSYDSRYYGPVPLDNAIGRVLGYK